jgi:hypothetical protein
MRALPLVVLVLGLAASPSEAEFRAFGQIEEIRDGQRVFFSPYDISGAVQAGDGKTDAIGGFLRMSASSLADIGGLRASAYGAVKEDGPNAELGFDLSRGGRAFAVGTYEVTITGPVGPVTTSFDMELGGTIGVVTANTAVDLNTANAGVGLVFRVDGSILVGNPQNPIETGSFTVLSTAGGPSQIISSGVLANWTAPVSTVTSPSFLVQGGTPFTLEIMLIVNGGANADATENAFIASGNADFGSTLRFPTGVPIFHLPAGYSVTSTDAGIVDNQVPCTSNCTRFQSKCDAGKLGCVAKRQACLLKVHAAAEKKGEAPAADALEKCGATLEPCIEKLEAKQKPEKPKTLCTVTGDLVALTLAGDAFVTGVVTTIDPSYPAVGPASVCDGGKKTCVANRTACLLKVAAAATKKGGPVDPSAMQKCADKFDGGAKGFDKGCVGKLQSKQKAEKPKTLCAVTDDGTALETAVDAFVSGTLGAILDQD